MVKWDESSRGVSTLWRGECDLQGVAETGSCYSLLF